MDPGVASVLGSLITLSGVVYVARQNKQQEKKLNEVHRQTTENSHSNASPTLLDELSDLKRMFNDHIKWHKEVK